MKKLIATLMFVSSVSLLSGCASIVDGTSQNVSVETPPVSGAICSLKNNKGKWFIGNTPGTVVVHRSNEALLVKCEKVGYQKAIKSFQSTTKAMIAGNIVFGGLIGGGVDAADGAAFRYPGDMQVPMKKH